MISLSPFGTSVAAELFSANLLFVPSPSPSSSQKVPRFGHPPLIGVRLVPPGLE